MTRTDGSGYRNTLIADARAEEYVVGTEDQDGPDAAQFHEPADAFVNDGGSLDDNADDESVAGLTPASSITPQEAPPRQNAGGQWRWDPNYGDYTQTRDNQLLLYTDIQRSARLEPQISTPISVPGSHASAAAVFPVTNSQAIAQDPRAQQLYQPRTRVADSPNVLDPNDGPPEGSAAKAPASASVSNARAVAPTTTYSMIPPQIPRSIAPGPPKKSYQEPLDPRFSTVEKPKRFFSIGRIFRVVWFEPGGQDTPARRSDMEWTSVCEPFHSERPYAKFRWFVVVRKRLHHSLCFSITTFGGRGATKASRGRAKDFVVLHSASMDPPAPFPEEEIQREPIAVIIEDGEQFISPLARLDCGRIYTVEDNLKVMKIGRVLPESLENLEAYYRESVE